MNHMTLGNLFGGFRALAALAAASLALCLFLSTSEAHAAPPGDQAAKDFVKTVADKALAIVQDASLQENQRKEKLRQLTRQEVALDYIAKLALGRFGRASDTAKPEDAAVFKGQLAEYRRLFPDFAFEKMYNLVLNDLIGAKIEVNGVTPVKDTDVIVSSKILRQGKEAIATDWRVRADSSGKLKIIDIVAEGVSLTISQRDDFGATGSAGGIAAIINSMKAVLANNSTAPAAAKH